MNSVVAGAAVVALVGSVAAQTVVRQGSGDRRAALDKMELQPFDTAHWSKLSDWTGGDPLTGERADGKVVLIVTWAAFMRPSVDGLNLAKRQAQRHGDDLIVVAAHHRVGWNDAAKEMAEGVLAAHDAEGAFRQAIRADSEPGFYLIDRAGNLRYADIQTGSVARAAEGLVAETREQAAAEPQRVADEQRRSREQARRTGEIRQDVDVADFPDDLRFDTPSQEEYEAVAWPSRDLEFEEKVLGRMFFGDDQQQAQRPLPFDSVPDGAFGRPPKKLDGRVTVVYFWRPDIHSTYERAHPRMDRLQRESWRDVNVIGVVFRRADPRNWGRNMEREEREIREFQRAVEHTKNTRRFEHTMISDPEAELFNALFSDEWGGGMRRDLLVPVAAIFSSDKTMRWTGNPLSSTFDAALMQILRRDPGVRNRRAVEDRWLRERSR